MLECRLSTCGNGGKIPIGPQIDPRLSVAVSCKRLPRERIELSMRSAPAIPLFGDAYMADTRHLSLEEHGAYLQLLMIAWRTENCCLPDDDARLARMIGVTAPKWKKLKPVVMAFWTLEAGAWTQRRLSKERAFVEEKRGKNRAAAEARWSGQASENKQSDGYERISERNAPPPPPPEVEEVSEASPHLARAPSQPVAKAVDCFNENALAVGWPTIRKVSPKRLTALRGILRDEGLEGWRSAIIRARASPYLGRDPPAWFTFDWLINASNFLKLTEGNYDRRHDENRGGGGRMGGPGADPTLALVRAAAEAQREDRGDHGPPRFALPSRQQR